MASTCLVRLGLPQALLESTSREFLTQEKRPFLGYRALMARLGLMRSRHPVLVRIEAHNQSAKHSRNTDQYSFAGSNSFQKSKSFFFGISRLNQGRGRTFGCASAALSSTQATNGRRRLQRRSHFGVHRFASKGPSGVLSRQGRGRFRKSRLKP
jgi:hypothetical protein